MVFFRLNPPPLKKRMAYKRKKTSWWFQTPFSKMKKAAGVYFLACLFGWLKCWLKKKHSSHQIPQPKQNTIPTRSMVYRTVYLHYWDPIKKSAIHVGKSSGNMQPVPCHWRYWSQAKTHLISKVSSEFKHPKTHMRRMGLEYIYLQYFSQKFEPLKCSWNLPVPTFSICFFLGPQTLVADRRNRQELTIPNVKDRIDALQYRLSKAVLLRKKKHHDVRRTFVSGVRSGHFFSGGEKMGGGVDCFLFWGGGIRDPFFFSDQIHGINMHTLEVQLHHFF